MTSKSTNLNEERWYQPMGPGDPWYALTEGISLSPSGDVFLTDFKRDLVYRFPSCLLTDDDASAIATDSDIGNAEREGLYIAHGDAEAFGLYVNCVNAEREGLYTTYRSPHFSAPHGIHVINPSFFLVTNREGPAYVFRMPPVALGASIDIEAWITIDMEHPGAAVTVPVDGHAHLYDVFLCETYQNIVMHHLMNTETLTTTLVRKSITDAARMPDSIGVSHDGQWLLVGNHECGTIHFLALDEVRREEGPSRSHAILRGVLAPHSFVFTRDGNFLIVADTASPFVFVFEKPPEGWSGDVDPTTIRRVISEEDFYRENTRNAEDGGTKGIALSHDGNHVIITSWHDRMTYLALEELLSHVAPPEDYQRLEWYRQRLTFFWPRLREGVKVGPASVAATMMMELDGRRRRRNVYSRTHQI